jgi:hypothetical protein
MYLYVPSSALELLKNAAIHFMENKSCSILYTDAVAVSLFNSDNS